MATKFEVVLSAKLDEKSVSDIQKQLDNISKGLKLDIKADTSSVDKMTSSVKDLGNAAGNAKTHTQGLGDIISKFSSWQIVGDVIHGVKNAMEDMVQQVFDLDESLTELDKVTDLTSSGLADLADDAFAVGEQIGATGKDVINATTLFAQAGYEAKDALDLGEQAIMLKNVSEAGATAEGSASTLIATMKAFNLDATESTHIVDALNQVSNKYAVSVNDLATAIKKSSASMAAGNNSLEQTFGLVTAGTEILREPGRVANGLSTITARLTQKNDEYIASITGGMGVIDKNTGELRSTFDVLQDLSKAWTHLTSVEKQELSETVAGKTQRSLFTAIMTNFESAVGATEQALNSEGSALEENNKRMESLNGRMQQLQSAWQDFARNTIDSEFVKNILSAVTGIIKLTNAMGGLAPILSTIVSTLLLLKSGSIANSIGKLTSEFAKFKTNVAGLGGGFKAFTLSLGGVKAGTDAAKTATMGLAGAMSTLSTALGVIGIVISIATTAYNLITNAQEEARQASIDSANKNLEEAKSIKKKIETEEDAITKLKEEKQELESLKSTDKGVQDKIKDKQEEIDTRQQNIDKMKEERKQASLNAIGDVSGQKGKNTAGGIHSYIHTGVESEDKKLAGYVKDFNVAIKEADGNTGKYNKTIDDMKTKYSELLSQQKENGEAYRATKKILELLNREQGKTADNFEKDSKLAEVYYNALKNGVTELEAGQDMVDWMQEFYGLTEEQMQQLEKGIDVKSQDASATDEQTKKNNELAQSISNVERASQGYQNTIDSNIKQIASYDENLSLLNDAVDQHNKNGFITADMYKQLQDAGLLQYLSMVNGHLVANTDEFLSDAEALKTNAEWAAKNKYAQDLLNLTLEIQKGNLNSLNQSQDDVTTASKNANTSNVVNQIANIGSAAGASMAQVQGLLRSLDGEKMSSVDMEKWSKEQEDAFNKGKAILDKQLAGSLAGINSIKLGGNITKKKGSGGSKSSKSSKTAKEEYKAEVDALYWYKNALDTAKDSVDKLNDALKNTDNFNEQEKYIRQLIDATNNQINKTNDLKNAQANQINDYINQLRAQGFAINYNASSNELYINNMERLGQLSGDNAKAMEKLIDKIQSLNDNNRNLDGSIRDLTADVKDYYQQLADFPEKKLEKFNDLMKEFQQSQLDVIQYQIDDIQHEMDNDPRLKALEEQIKALEKQNDELDNQKELEEKLLAVEEAKIKLQNAQRQKTLQVYREGQGFVWETDPDSIKEAAEELKDAQDDLNDKIKQDQIDQLKAEKEALEKSYQDRIDALEKFLDEQNYLIDKANREGAQTFDELRKELAKFGLDSAEYLGKATDWLNNYNKSLAELNETVGGILSSSSQATDGMIYSSAVQDRIDQALSSLIPSITPSTGLTLSNIDFDKIKGTDKGQSIYINNIELPNVQDIDDFVAALRDLPNMATSQSSQRN